MTQILNSNSSRNSGDSIIISTATSASAASDSSTSSSSSSSTSALSGSSLSEAPCRYCGTPSVLSPYCCKACEQLDQIVELQGKGGITTAPQVPDSLRFLEDSENLRNFSQNESLTEFVFRVDGLECASCVHLIEKLPMFYANLNEATIDYSQSLLFLQLKEPQGLGSLVQLLKEWGYAATPIRKDELLLPQIRQENRKQLMRLGLTGALTGNIMILTIPIYAGVEGVLKVFFMWLHFALFLPLIFYSAVPFYRGAWNSLKVQALSVDLPITLALWTGFIFSTVNLVRGLDDVYFDSTASFIFLILVTRYFVHRIQQIANNQRALSTFIPPQTFRKLEIDGSWSEISSDKIRPGQWLCVNQDQIIPADGVLNSPVAEIDASLFSGESLPQIYHTGTAVFAGTKLISKSASFQVTKVDTFTALGEILTELAKEALKKNTFVQLTDRLSQGLIAAVLLLACGYFTLNYQANFQEAFHRALALIIVACPCAMAFGTPLAFALGLKKARKQGLLIKNAAVFEKMRNIKSVFLDKTGTVTRGQLHLVKSYPPEISTDFRSLILGLEAQSQHPVAFAFRRAWPDEPVSRSLEDLQELPGVGVQGRERSSLWTVETSGSQESSGFVSVSLKQDNQAVAYFYFADEIQPESKAVVNKLRINFEVNLLSGDRKTIVAEIAEACGISRDHFFADASPQLKRDIVGAHPGSMMVGDGVNDILAFRAADVSVAVRSSQLQNQNWADVICLREGIRPLLDLVTISEQTYRTLVANLTFAIFYNAFAGFLALCGVINPLIAAILMPISSLCILGITMRGLR
jgi:Cu+-exporting ATPase